MTLRLPTRMRSFRFRIALLSTFLSGLVLVAFCAGAWLLILQVNLNRVDEDIRRMGLPLSMGQAPRDWANVDESVRFVLGEEQEEPVILLVKGRGNEVLYSSQNWPPELSADAFPEPVEGDLGSEVWDLPGEEGRTSGPWFRGPGEPWPRGENAPPGPPGGFRMGPPPGRASTPGENGLGAPDQGPPRGWPPRIPGGPPPPHAPLKTRSFFTAGGGGHEWRIGVMSSPDVTFVLGRNMSRFRDEMRSLRNAFLVALPIALLLIAAGEWWVSQRALRPVRTLTATAEGMTAKGLDQRIPVKDDDAEFNRLISVFNGMMDRLEKSFRQAVRFSADAAHELKTPLTILQGELEQVLQAAAPGSLQQQTYNTLLEEVQRLKTVIRKLLLLSLADSGQLKPNLESLDLTAAMEAAIEDAEILAPNLTIEQELESEVGVSADGDLIRQVIQNLVSNAIKYNRPGGTIRFLLRRAARISQFVKARQTVVSNTGGGNVLLTVSNTGIGIPAEDRDKVFERFYRADKARNRKVDGAGLGLSLSREIARAHQGDLVLEDTQDGTTAFTMILPGTQSPSGMPGSSV